MRTQLALSIVVMVAVIPMGSAVAGGPMSVTATWTAESNQDNAGMGAGLQTAGDVNGDGYSDVIASAPNFSNGNFLEGRVWLFLGSATGLAATAAWTAEGEQDVARLGGSIAGVGDVNGDGFDDVLVGAPERDNGQSDEGQVFLYLGSAAGLAATPAWTLDGNVAFAGLGGTIAGAGDVNGDGYADVLIGDAGFTNGQSGEGRAMLFLGSASGLSLSPSWTVEGNQADGAFGVSVAGAGDVNGDGYGDIVIGAFMYSNGQPEEGAAFVYHGAASGPSTTAARVLDINQTFSQFGASVAAAGDVNGDGYADVIVGAPSYTNGEAGEGAAFLFPGSASGVVNTPQWTGEGNQAPTPGFNDGTSMGCSVATAGDVNGDGYADVIVGARNYDVSIKDEGVTFLFIGGPAGLSTTHLLRPRGNQINAAFGGQVATAGDVNADGYSDVLASATNFDAGQTNEGRVFLFAGAAAMPGPAAQWTGEGGAQDARYGEATASAGDVNGDGYSDILVGAPSASGPLGGEGRVYLYLGSPTGPALAPAWTLTGTQFVELLGTAIASAGDVNGDGYSDVVVGSERYANANTFAGRVRLYLGSASGLSAVPAWTVEGAVQGAVVGREVASAGDVNADGYSDVLVGTGQQLRLYLGSATGLAAVPAWTGPPTVPSGIHHASIASAGDVNGDGRSDVVVGSPGYTGGQLDEGRALLYLGTGTGLTSSPVWGIEADNPGQFLGASVASAGDVDGDGYADVIVGQPSYSGDQALEGAAFLFLGGANGLEVVPAWLAEGNSSSSYFGTAVSGLGDINLDGYGDVVVGMPNPSFTGFARVFLGSPAGLAETPIVSLSVSANANRFGWSTRNAGDVNGDGFPDLIVGSPYYTAPDLREGGAFVYYGNGNDGFDRLSRQWRIDGTAPIHFLGKSGDNAGFRLAERGIPPAGRSRIKLEWEIKPLGTPFDGTGIGSTPMADTGAPGPSGSLGLYSQIVSGLGAGTHFHWRTRIIGDDPRFPRSPWKSLPNNAPTETKIRTSGCGDQDGDGRGRYTDPACPVAGEDCLDGDGTVWALPGPTAAMLFSNKTTLSWSAPANAGGTAALVYGVVRLDSGAGFTGPACLADPNNLDTTIAVGANPTIGTGYYFLSRAKNACGPGSWGQGSSGAERSYPLTCP